MKTYVLTAFLIFLCFSSVLSEESSVKQTKITVALTDFVGRGLAEGEAVTLTDAFRSYLINTNAFRVMERSKMDEIMKEQGFQASGACTDQACMVEMGQMLGVDRLAAGSVGKVGETYSVNVRFISVETGEITKTVNKFYKGQIDGLLTEVLSSIANDLAGVEKPAGEANETVSEPKDKAKPKDTSKKGGGSAKWVILGLGTVAVGGGAAAYVLTKKKGDEGGEGGAVGEIELTW
ncbi:MAG: CsgG/HfaB family protein [bacterium]